MLEAQNFPDKTSACGGISLRTCLFSCQLHFFLAMDLKMRLAIAAALTVAQRWIAAAMTVHSTVHSVSNEFNLDSIDRDQSFTGTQPMELACGDEISGFRDGLTPGQPHIFCPITPSPIGRARAVTCGSSFAATVSSNATIKDEVCLPACVAPCIEFVFRQVSTQHLNILINIVVVRCSQLVCLLCYAVCVGARRDLFLQNSR
eukprot:s2147_g14.t1